MFLRAAIASFLFVFSVSSYASKLPTSFDGCVTHVAWPDEFDVGTRHVKFDRAKMQVSMPEQDAGDSIDSLLRVGAIVHVDGTFEKKTSVFVATAIAFQPSYGDKGKQNQKLDGIGLIEEKPQLSPNAQGISGTLWVDGYLLQVTPQTKLLAVDGKPFPIGQIHPNVWAFFDAVRKPNGFIEAQSITFSLNAVDADEVKYRDQSEPEIVLPDYPRHIPGKIKFHYRGTPSIPWTLDILPDKAVQDYVTKVGESLIPQYQKDISASDSTKINFRFFVVQKPSKWKETLNDASSTAGGVIYIPDNVLAVLDNEAQLAALLSNCIARTLEKQSYVHRTHGKIENGLAWTSDLAPGLIGLPVGIGNGIAAHQFWLKVNEQASRIGLRYMLHSGYDLAEAPFAWTVAANEKVENPLQSGETSFSPLVQSVMNDLYFNYASTDYANLKTNREAYQQMVAALRRDDPKLPKAKNRD